MGTFKVLLSKEAKLAASEFDRVNSKLKANNYAFKTALKNNFNSNKLS